jgi:uncharacterized protein YkwD
VKISGVLLALFVLAGCSHMPDVPGLGGGKQGARLGTPLPPPPDPKTQMPALENRIAALVQDERLKLDPAAKLLVLDPELSLIARRRAEDMAAKNYLAHAAPNGDTSASLLMAQDEKFQGLLGENLAAQHYTKLSGVAVDAFAQRFLDTWVKSVPHRDNLAFADYNRTGVGAAVNGDTVYVAQLFATDLGLGPHQDTDPPGAITSFDNPQTAKETKPPPMPAVPPARLRGSEDHAPPPQGQAQ